MNLAGASYHISREEKVNAAELLGDAPIQERFVSEPVANQIGFGENLLELVYPDISICSFDQKLNYVLS